MANGIECYGPEVADWTRTCLTIKTKGNFNETELLGVGPKIGTSEYQTFLDNYSNLLKKTSLVSLSGSWPQNSIGANYSSLVEQAASLNRRLFIDCSGNLLKDTIAMNPFGVHINQHEGYDIYGLSNPLEISLKPSDNCTISAITYGEKGLYLYDGKKMVHAVCKVERVISTVGSGDSLMAGLLVASKRNYSLMDMARLGAACGAANCIREDLGMFYRKDVELLMERCEVNLVTI